VGSCSREQGGVKGQFGQVNAEHVHRLPPLWVASSRLRVRDQPCRYALAACRESILHSLSEHACQRIMPILDMVSWTQDIHDIRCAAEQIIAGWPAGTIPKGHSLPHPWESRRPFTQGQLRIHGSSIGAWTEPLCTKTWLPTEHKHTIMIGLLTIEPSVPRV
jgi:hypothetical protein